MLRVRSDTVRDWAHAGAIRYEVVDRRFVFNVDDVKRLVDALKDFEKPSLRVIRDLGLLLYREEH
ncbi:hypothetical protein ABZ801_00910 [Actinomadura sp. NPDC047616]|uniref:hypothetical protein n=1 Tax=Actinomadura sp. NPDC047616 TaxID=3155914 RepID=UPI0033F69CFA